MKITKERYATRNRDCYGELEMQRYNFLQEEPNNHNYDSGSRYAECNQIVTHLEGLIVLHYQFL